MPQDVRAKMQKLLSRIIIKQGKINFTKAGYCNLKFLMFLIQKKLLTKKGFFTASPANELSMGKKNQAKSLLKIHQTYPLQMHGALIYYRQIYRKEYNDFSKKLIEDETYKRYKFLC